MRLGLAWLGLVAMAGVATDVRADIYSFVDDQGVEHFSNVPTDGRFELLAKEPVEAPAGGPAVTRADLRQREAKYLAMITRAADVSSVHPALVRAVIQVESAFNARAVSRAGAQGLMQLAPVTSRRYGVGNPFDPEENLRGGTRYLRDLLKRYNNDLELVLAAYNAGEDAVERYGRQIPPFPETRRYVPAVLRRYHELLTGAS